jgi:hypothetical protein
VSDVGVVAIGRNEGDRLRRCLASVLGRGWPVVYVDSASTDGSAETARSMGAEVVGLDMSLPFSAARARNAGFERLTQIAPGISFVQFVDGDCEVVDGWIERALRAFKADDDEIVAIVCGRRRERFPEASVYNRLADLEWDTPVGEADSCGGDAMMRIEALQAVGGFDPSVAAGEEPELCQRLRQRGWKILRIDTEMTLHDSAMLTFGQWWKRAVRSGYGAMDVATRFRNVAFLRQARSARQWALMWPGVVLAVAIGLMASWIFAVHFGPEQVRAELPLRIAITVTWIVSIFLILPLQMLRVAIGARKRAPDLRTALAYGFLTMIGKWANWRGQVRYRRDRKAGKNTRLIEYKAASVRAQHA